MSFNSYSTRGVDGGMSEPGFSSGSNFSGAHEQRRTILLVVMGVTGVGKTSFINVADRGDRVREPSLEPSTSDIYQHDTFTHRGCDIILVDTPGFDNDTKPDMSVLEQFVQFLKVKASEGIRLSGIIYLHRITDVRMGGSAIKNIQLLREICGNQFLRRVTLVTSMWDCVRQEVGENRETELKSSYWKDILDHGAMYHRQDGKREGALRIIDGYFDESLPPVTLRSNIERQIMERGTPLPETDAGRFALERLRHKILQFKAKLEERREEQRENVYDQGLEEEANHIEQEIRKGERELESYKTMLADSKGSGGEKQRQRGLTFEERMHQPDFAARRPDSGSQQSPSMLEPETWPSNDRSGDGWPASPRDFSRQSSTRTPPQIFNRPQSSHIDGRPERNPSNARNRNSSYNQWEDQPYNNRN